MGRIRKSVQYFAFITALILAGEIVIRVFYGDGFLSLVDPQLHHRKRPYINIVRTWGAGEDFRLITNSLGWRDTIPNHRIKKVTDKKMRIVFLGDSFPEGIGYDQEEISSGIVEKRLNETGFNCEVLNGGTVSYSPLIEYMQLKRFLNDGYKTDIVVLLPDLSDIQDEALYYKNKYMFDKDDEPVKFKVAYPGNPLLCAVLNSSCLARASAMALKNSYIYAKIKGFFTKKAAGPPPSEAITSEDLATFDLAEHMRLRGNWEMHRPSLDSWAREGLDSFITNIGRIKRLCDKNGIRLLVVIYPWPQQLYVKDNPEYYKVLRIYFHELYAARESIYGRRPSDALPLYESTIISFCRENSIKLLDFYPDFIEMENWHDYYLANDMHFNRKGHKLVAEKIVGALMEMMQ